MKSFEELECYQEARKFRMRISAFRKTLPSDERYALADQIRRSSRSVTANIAEGYGRHNHQENLQFCRTARGSLTETLDHLITAMDEGYLTQKDLESLRTHYETCHRLLNGYIAYIRRCGGK